MSNPLPPQTSADVVIFNFIQQLTNSANNLQNAITNGIPATQAAPGRVASSAATPTNVANSIASSGLVLATVQSALTTLQSALISQAQAPAPTQS